jgi:hypothetical protein
LCAITVRPYAPANDRRPDGRFPGGSGLPLAPSAGGRVPGRRARYAFFSDRHPAVATGLGAFGLNNLLLTPEYGPRVRLESMITTAELVPDPLCERPACLGADACGLCLEASDCFGEIHELEMAGKTM